MMPALLSPALSSRSLYISRAVVSKKAKGIAGIIAHRCSSGNMLKKL